MDHSNLLSEAQMRRVMLSEGLSGREDFQRGNFSQKSLCR